jgi:hypothetical protein
LQHPQPSYSNTLGFPQRLELQPDGQSPTAAAILRDNEIPFQPPSLSALNNQNPLRAEAYTLAVHGKD